jgi:hypothetical protein
MMPVSISSEGGRPYSFCTSTMESFLGALQHFPGLSLLAVVLFCFWWKSQRQKSKRSDKGAEAALTSRAAANSSDALPVSEPSDKVVHKMSQNNPVGNGVRPSYSDAQHIAAFRMILDPPSIPDPLIQDQLRQSIAKILGIPPTMV